MIEKVVAALTNSRQQMSKCILLWLTLNEKFAKIRLIFTTLLVEGQIGNIPTVPLMDWTPRPAFDCSFLMLVKVNVYCRHSMKPKLMIFYLIFFYLDDPCHFCKTRGGFLEVTTLASFSFIPCQEIPKQAASFN